MNHSPMNIIGGHKLEACVANTRACLLRGEMYVQNIVQFDMVDIAIEMTRLSILDGV